MRPSGSPSLISADRRRSIGEKSTDSRSSLARSTDIFIRQKYLKKIAGSWSGRNVSQGKYLFKRSRLPPGQPATDATNFRPRYVYAPCKRRTAWFFFRLSTSWPALFIRCPLLMRFAGPTRERKDRIDRFMSYSVVT